MKDRDDIFEIDRLLKVVEGPEPAARLDVLSGAVAGEEDHLQGRDATA